MTEAEYRLLAASGKSGSIPKSLGVYRNLKIADLNKSNLEANGLRIEVQKKN